jgi:2-iminobutanoate/2-iminopropanoate deaminase
MANDVVATPQAPAAIGPYSQGIKAKGFLFTAGQIPLIPETMEVVEGGITEQAERVMENLAAILREAGTSFDRAVKTTCYLANFGDFAAFNEVYGRYFTSSPPARSTVEASKLPRNVLVEVDCIATVDDEM